MKQFSSESVCAGHPDKIADQISDAILDALLAQDPYSHVGVEVMLSNKNIIIAGEVRTNAVVNYANIAKNVVHDIGYTYTSWGFSDKTPVICNINQQSQDIYVGVGEDAAGDQGFQFGYACKETPELMPLPITIAHALTRVIDSARTSDSIPYLRPDGKSQVVVSYDSNGKPVDIDHVTIAVPHSEDVDYEQIKDDVYMKIITPTLNKFGFGIAPNKVAINGTGVWHIPGPQSDAGLTGRKIVVDTYGGYARVGGGCFSGKSPNKVDRSGAYAARYIAKNIVANDLADKVEVALAYYIGAKEPVMINIDTFGTGKVSDKAIKDFANKLLVPSVANIIDVLDLRKPVYKDTATYGHFGNKNFTWEMIR